LSRWRLVVKIGFGTWDLGLGLFVGVSFRKTSGAGTGDQTHQNYRYLMDGLNLL
jgi:hypothetical protein